MATKIPLVLNSIGDKQQLQSGDILGANITGNSSSTTNISGGAAGSLPYQTSSGTTTLLAATTNGYILTLSGGLPVWAANASSYNPAAVAITGGTINNTSVGATTQSTGAFTTLTASGSMIASGVIANKAITGALNQGAFAYGTLAYTDVNIFESLTTSVNSYSQTILQNTSATAASSVDFIVSNDVGTATSFYGDFGITSSVYNTPGQNITNIPSTVYLQSANCDLAIGTISAKAIHIMTTSVEQITIASTGIISMLANITSTTTATGTLVVTGGVGVSGAVYAGSFNGVIGSGTANTGAFTTLSASGVMSVTNSTAATSASVGALVVTGGVSSTSLYSSIGTFGNTTGGLYMAPLVSSPTYGAIYATTVTPSNTDFSLAINNTNTVLNAATTVNLAIGGSYLATLTSAGLSVPTLVSANVTLGSATAGLVGQLLVSATGYGALYSATVTPSLTNYAICANNIQTVLNSTTTVNLAIGNTYVLTAVAGGITIPTLVSTNSTTAFAIMGTAVAGFVGQTLVGGAAGYGALYPTTVTPAITNYTLTGNNTQTVINAVTTLNLAASNAYIVAVTSTGMAVTGALSSSGATTMTAGTASTTTATGTLVVTGGVGVSGAVYAGSFNGVIGSGTANTGMFTTVQGGVTTNGLIIRAFTGGASAGSIYSSAVTPANANYALTAYSTNTAINGTTQVYSCINNIVVTTVTSTGMTVTGSLSTTGFHMMPAPVTVTAASYTQVTTAPCVIFNTTANCTVTMLSAATYNGAMIIFKNIAAFTVISASSNIVPIGSATAGTSIMPATVGSSVIMVSNGTNWVIMK